MEPSPGALRWPSGPTFLTYCAGISLLILVGYIVVHGQGFIFDVGKEGVKLQTLKSSLNPQGAKVDITTQEKSKELDEIFKETTQSQPAVAVVGPFNGRWTGNGSTYILEQRGAMVAFQEVTNGIVTSAGQGTANGNHASVTAMNITGLTIPIEISIHGTQLTLAALGNSYILDPA